MNLTITLKSLKDFSTRCKYFCAWFTLEAMLVTLMLLSHLRVKINWARELSYFWESRLSFKISWCQRKVLKYSPFVRYNLKDQLDAIGYRQRRWNQVICSTAHLCRQGDTKIEYFQCFQRNFSSYQGWRCEKVQWTLIQNTAMLKLILDRFEYGIH